MPGTVGTLLNVKPILTTRRNGEATIIERVRTRRKALEHLVELTAGLGELEGPGVHQVVPRWLLGPMKASMR